MRNGDLKDLVSDGGAETECDNDTHFCTSVYSLQDFKYPNHLMIGVGWHFNK